MLESLKKKYQKRLVHPIHTGIIIKDLDLLRAKKTFIRRKFGHTAVSAIKASSVTL